jgi:hypothetical protein
MQKNGIIKRLSVPQSSGPQGNFSGSARGGGEVSLVWEKGKPVASAVKKLNGDGPCQRRCGGRPAGLTAENGAATILEAGLN